MRRWSRNMAAGRHKFWKARPAFNRLKISVLYFYIPRCYLEGPPRWLPAACDCRPARNHTKKPARGERAGRLWSIVNRPNQTPRQLSPPKSLHLRRSPTTSQIYAFPSLLFKIVFKLDIKLERQPCSERSEQERYFAALIAFRSFSSM